MLELPESTVIARQVGETLMGKTIKKVIAGASPHSFAWYFGDPADYQIRLAGKRIEGAAGLGSMLEIAAQDCRIVLSDGVNIRYLDTAEKAPAKHQLYLEFEDGTAIVCTVQMYGGLLAFAIGENDNPYYIRAKEAPQPLTDAFDEAYFEKLRTEKTAKLSAKAFLATEQRIPGLGNGVLQDILFNARIHPKRKINTLTDLQYEALYTAVKDTLAQMTAAGGRDTEKDLFGNAGGYKTILSKNTLEWPCPVCGGRIVKEAYLGGAVYYCPICQPVST